MTLTFYADTLDGALQWLRTEYPAGGYTVDQIFAGYVDAIETATGDTIRIYY